MLDQMVLKLARIMKHIMPENNNIQIDANVDTATSAWLNTAYNTNNTRMRIRSYYVVSLTADTVKIFCLFLVLYMIRNNNKKYTHFCYII